MSSAKRKKKKARGRPSRLKSPRDETSSGLVILKDRLSSSTFRQFKDLNIRIIGIAVTSYALFVFSLDKEFLETHTSGYGIMYAAIFSWLFVIGCGAYNLFRLMRYSQVLVTERWLKNWFILHTSLNVLLLSIPAFLIFYRLGFITLVSALISRHWQSASNWTVNAISATISFVLSGVVGNFAYDLLKRLVSRKKK